MLETFFAFFAFGALGFYLLLLGVFGGVWWCIHHDRGLWAMGSVALTGLLVNWMAELGAYQWFLANWAAGGIWFLKYLGLGMLFAVVRWGWHLWRSMTKLKEHEQLFLRDREGDLDALYSDPQLRFDFAKFLEERNYNPCADKNYAYRPARDGVHPTFDQNKYAIGRWLTWWPWCAIDWLLADLLILGWDLARDSLEGIVNWMSRLVFANRANLALSATQIVELEAAERAAAAERRKDKKE